MKIFVATRHPIQQLRLHNREVQQEGELDTPKQEAD
jgi:hypothetical protein